MWVMTNDKPGNAEHWFTTLPCSRLSLTFLKHIMARVRASYLVSRLRGILNSPLRSELPSQRRHFSARSACRTDGVYSEITAMRTRTPFIEAFRRQQAEINGVSKTLKSSTPEVAVPKPDLSPRTMSDSYYRVVCCTYLLFQASADLVPATPTCTGSLAS